MCARGTSSTCPLKTGRRSRNPRKSGSSRTMSAGTSPPTIEQKTQSTLPRLPWRPDLRRPQPPGPPHRTSSTQPWTLWLETVGTGLFVAVGLGLCRLGPFVVDGDGAAVEVGVDRGDGLDDRVAGGCVGDVVTGTAEAVGASSVGGVDVVDVLDHAPEPLVEDGSAHPADDGPGEAPDDGGWSGR